MVGDEGGSGVSVMVGDEGGVTLGTGPGVEVEDDAVRFERV